MRERNKSTTFQISSQIYKISLQYILTTTTAKNKKEEGQIREEKEQMFNDHYLNRHSQASQLYAYARKDDVCMTQAETLKIKQSWNDQTKASHATNAANTINNNSTNSNILAQNNLNYTNTSTVNSNNTTTNNNNNNSINNNTNINSTQSTSNINNINSINNSNNNLNSNNTMLPNNYASQSMKPQLPIQNNGYYYDPNNRRPPPIMPTQSQNTSSEFNNANSLNNLQHQQFYDVSFRRVM